jgi:hypothetical protein
MTTVEITLPDELAQEAETAGLLAPDALAGMLRERLRAERLGRMSVAQAILAADPLDPMTTEEINAEIAAYRAEKRRAAGS